MGSKRTFSGDDESANSYPRQDAPRKRPKTKGKLWQRPEKEMGEALSAIKKRARAIERLFMRDNTKLPLDKRRDLERELAAHKRRIAEAREKKERNHMIGKYHMVRFFERKKAMRLAKQLERRIADATDPDEIATLKADLHVAQVDMDYAKYYPFLEPYVALYAAASGAKEDVSSAAKALRSERPPMWAEVEKLREKGERALRILQNRNPKAAWNAEDVTDKDNRRDATKKPSKDTAKHDQTSAGKRRRNGQDEASRKTDVDEENGSDGGEFFEF